MIWGCTLLVCFTFLKPDIHHINILYLTLKFIIAQPTDIMAYYYCNCNIELSVSNFSDF